VSAWAVSFGCGGAGVGGGGLVVAAGLVLLGLPGALGGGLPVRVDATDHAGRGGFGGPGMQLYVALEMGGWRRGCHARQCPG